MDLFVLRVTLSVEVLFCVRRKAPQVEQGEKQWLVTLYRRIASVILMAVF